MEKIAKGSAMQFSEFFAFIRPLTLLLVAPLSLVAQPARADCRSDIAAFNRAVEHLNETWPKLSCNNLDLVESELVPTYAQAIAAQQRVLKNRCPLTKVGASVEDLRRHLETAKKVAAECRTAEAARKAEEVKRQQEFRN